MANKLTPDQINAWLSVGDTAGAGALPAATVSSPWVLAPTEDSPGKGSRDLMMQDATAWGAGNIGKYLWENQGDPLGIFDPAEVQSFLSGQNFQTFPTPDDPRYGTAEFNNPSDPKYTKEGFTPSQFTGATPEQIKAYTDRVRNDYIAAGNQGNDAMWLPTFVEQDGKQYVQIGKQNTKDNGIGTMLEAALYKAAVAAVLGAGASNIFGGLPTAAPAGIAEEAAALGIGGEFGGGGLVSGLSQAEAIAYVKDARDAIEAITRLAEVAGGSAEAGATALGFSGADAALQSLVPSMLNAAANGVPGTSGLPTPSSPPTPPMKQIKDTLGTASNALGVASAVGAIGETVGNASDDPYESIRADEAARQDRIAKSVADIRGQFGRFDDNYLKGVSSSYLDYYLPQFNEQAKEARRQTVFATPAAGTSAFARRAGQLETDIGRQEVNIRSQAEQQAQNQKARLANQEETLVSQAEGAGGIADASARAASAADIASTPEPFSPLGQLFAAYTGNVANASLAERQGYAPTGIVPNIFSRPGGRQPVQYVG